MWQHERRDANRGASTAINKAPAEGRVQEPVRFGGNPLRITDAATLLWSASHKSQVEQLFRLAHIDLPVASKRYRPSRLSKGPDRGEEFSGRALAQAITLKPSSGADHGGKAGSDTSPSSYDTKGRRK